MADLQVTKAKIKPPIRSQINEKKPVHIYGHWHCEFELPKDAIGFIYQITNLVTGKMYIGRKNFEFKRRKQVKCITDPTKKKTQIKTTESDWKTYTGSSTSLNKDIELLGKTNFRFEILSTHTTKAALNYAEVEALVMRGALTTYMANGEPAFYNGMIPPVKTRPPMHK